MSFILGQMLLCLLIAGLIGAIIGWLMRGSCSKKLRDCQDEWKMKMGSLESEYHTKLQYAQNQDSTLEEKATQEATLKRHNENVKSQPASYSYEKTLQEELNIAQNATTNNSKSLLTGAAALGSSTLLARNISLSDEKISLYSEHGIDFENAKDLEDNYNVQALTGLEVAHFQKLQTMGITSTKDFASLSNDSKASAKISKELGIQSSTVDSWIEKSCLLELPGVDIKTADLMYDAGITSKKLSSYNPQELHKEISLYNQKQANPIAVPDLKSFSLWAKVAKLSSMATGAVAAASLSKDSAKERLASQKITLSDEKIKLYTENGVNFEDANLEDNYDIRVIEGIGPKYAQSLKEMGITTTQELVSKLYKNRDKIDQVSKTLQIQPEVLSSWISMADLIQLPGVDAQVAELMQTVGISTTKELGVVNPISLHSEMVAFNKKSPIVPEVPAPVSITLWSKLAKVLG